MTRMLTNCYCSEILPSMVLIDFEKVVNKMIFLREGNIFRLEHLLQEGDYLKREKLLKDLPNCIHMLFSAPQMLINVFRNIVILKRLVKKVVAISFRDG